MTEPKVNRFESEFAEFIKGAHRDGPPRGASDPASHSSVNVAQRRRAAGAGRFAPGDASHVLRAGIAVTATDRPGHTGGQDRDAEIVGSPRGQTVAWSSATFFPCDPRTGGIVARGAGDARRSLLR